MMARRSIALVAILLVPVLSAGCTTDDQPSRPIAVAPPIGSWAVYESENGTRLEVRIAGFDQVRDAWGTVHHAAGIDHTLLPKNESNGIKVREYVSLHNGLQIRQDTDCGSTMFEPEDPCWSPYPEAIFFTHGLPGGMGFAPQWVGAEDPVEVVPLDPVGFQTAPPGPLEWQRVPRQGDCWLRQSRSVEAWHPFGSWLPITTIATPLLQCEGIPFPVEFIPDMALLPVFEDAAPVFRLQEWSSGTGAGWPLQDATPWTPRAPPAPNPREPLGLLGDEGEIVRFTSREAHDWFLENDPRYARLIDEGASIVRTAYGSGRSEYTVGGGKVQEGLEWSLVVRPADGSEGEAFILRKTILFGPFGEELSSSYEVREPRGPPYGLEPSRPVPVPAVGLEQVARLAHSFFGCSINHLDKDPRHDAGLRNGYWEAVSEERVTLRASRPPEDWTGGWVSPTWNLGIDGLTAGITEMSAGRDHIDAYDARGLEPTTCAEGGSDLIRLDLVGPGGHSDHSGQVQDDSPSEPTPIAQTP